MPSSGTVITVCTNTGARYLKCRPTIELEEFDKRVNCYIDDHAYVRIHVGIESTLDCESALCHRAVTIFRKPLG